GSIRVVEGIPVGCTQNDNAERAADCLAKLGSTVPCTTTTYPVSRLIFNLHSDTIDGNCRSLRERTGVDHRLERLPSGPINKTPLYTVITGVNTNKILRNVGCGQSYTAAELPANKPKNRATLRGGNSSPHRGRYRQPETRLSDLLAVKKMAWEQYCPAIIALTKCVEKGRDKCHQYWPDVEHSSVVYSDIEGKQISGLESDTNRKIPLFSSALNVPLKARRLSALNKPTIVHCSKTILNSVLESEGRVHSLQSIVFCKQYKLIGPSTSLELCTKCDTNGVTCPSNEQQYIFIHHCILHAIESIASERSGMTTELHQNPVFEDDDTIAESDF
ncbi:Protein-tyrosine phosphatase, partial [Ostertagia ostertagi]